MGQLESPRQALKTASRVAGRLSAYRDFVEDVLLVGPLAQGEYTPGSSFDFILVVDQYYYEQWREQLATKGNSREGRLAAAAFVLEESTLNHVVGSAPVNLFLLSKSWVWLTPAQELEAIGWSNAHQPFADAQLHFSRFDPKARSFLKAALMLEYNELQHQHGRHRVPEGAFRSIVNGSFMLGHTGNVVPNADFDAIVSGTYFADAGEAPSY